MSNVVSHQFPPIPADITSHSTPATTIELFDLQDILAWAAIGAKHLNHRDIAREMQARSDAVNARLEALGEESGRIIAE